MQIKMQIKSMNQVSVFTFWVQWNLSGPAKLNQKTFRKKSEHRHATLDGRDKFQTLARNLVREAWVTAMSLPFSLNPTLLKWIWYEGVPRWRIVRVPQNVREEHLKSMGPGWHHIKVQRRA